MSPLLITAVIIFLAIFAAAAILTLLSLIGKVKMAEKYQKQLFTVLLLEVIGVVIAFVSYNLKPTMVPDISEKILSYNNGAWDWNFPEACWRTKTKFGTNKDNGQLYFTGITYFHYKDTVRNSYVDIPIYEWQSVEPISIPNIGNEILFKVEKKTLDGIKISEPHRISEIGKIEKGTIVLNTNIALTGKFLSEDKLLEWGIVLNYTK